MTGSTSGHSSKARGESKIRLLYTNKCTISVYRKQIAMLKSRLENGENASCFMRDLIESGQTEHFSEEQVCFIAGVMMEAGSDTTRMSLHQFVAGAALWPDWIARARVELDAVCGPHAERLPAFSDEDRLPLIKGAVKETFRWKYVTMVLGAFISWT